MLRYVICLGISEHVSRLWGVMSLSAGSFRAGGLLRPGPDGPTRGMRRALAIVSILFWLGVTVWGVFLQPPVEPFRADLPETITAWNDPVHWFLNPLPHPHFHQMPVKPIGTMRDFVPVELVFDQEAFESGVSRRELNKRDDQKERRKVARVIVERSRGRIVVIDTLGAVWWRLDDGRFEPLNFGFFFARGENEVPFIYDADFDKDGTLVVVGEGGFVGSIKRDSDGKWQRGLIAQTTLLMKIDKIKHISFSNISNIFWMIVSDESLDYFMNFDTKSNIIAPPFWQWYDGRRINALAEVNINQMWVAEPRMVTFARPGSSEFKLSKKNNVSFLSVFSQLSGITWFSGLNSTGIKYIYYSFDSDNVGQLSHLGYYPAPWLYPTSIFLLAFAGYLSLRAWRPDPDPPLQSISGQGVTDRPMRLTEAGDALNFAPIALSLSRFLRNLATEPPITIAVSGRWGTGKSSLMNMLTDDLARHGCRPAWFNAWHHHQEEHLLAALIETIRQQVVPPWWTISGLHFRGRLLWRRAGGTLIGATLVMTTLAVAASIIWWSVGPDRLGSLVSGLYVGSALTPMLDEKVVHKVEAAVPFGGSVVALLLLVLWLRQQLSALPSEPAKLMSRFLSRTRVRDFRDQLSFRHRFSQEFEDLCWALRDGRSPGLVIVVDDLDRCRPNEVLDVLEAINFLVSAGPCFVVLGIDRRQVEHCVGVGFGDVVDGLPDDDLRLIPGEIEVIAGTDSEANRRAARRRAYARHYLEKLINIEVPVPSLTDAGARSMLPGGGEDVSPPSVPHWVDGLKVFLPWFGRSLVLGIIAVLVAGVVITWLDSGVGPLILSEGTEARGTTGGAQERVENQSGEIASGSTGTEETKSEDTTGPKTQPLVPALKTVDPTTFREPIWWTVWVPSLLLGLGIVGWLVVAFLRRDAQEVRDSPAFARALDIVLPLVYRAHATPRSIKRFQNRMRYLSVRLNPPPAEVDTLEWALFWFGRRVIREGALFWFGVRVDGDLVPEERIDPPHVEALSEPKLLLLGAIETFDRRLLDQTPEAVLAWLDESYEFLHDLARTPENSDTEDAGGDPFASTAIGSPDRWVSWRDVREAFRSDPICRDHWPTLDDIRRYRGLLAAADGERPPADGPSPDSQIPGGT